MTGIPRKLTDVLHKTTDLQRKLTDVCCKTTDVLYKTIDLPGKPANVLCKITDASGRLTDVCCKTTDVSRKLTDVHPQLTNLPRMMRPLPLFIPGCYYPRLFERDACLEAYRKKPEKLLFIKLTPLPGTLINTNHCPAYYPQQEQTHENNQCYNHSFQLL